MSIPWDRGVPCYSNRGHSIYYWLGKRSSDVQIQTSKEGKREVMITRNRRAGNVKKRGLMGNKLGKQQFQRFSTAVSYQEAIIALSPLLGQDKHLFGRGALELFDWRRKMSIVQRSWESFFLQWEHLVLRKRFSRAGAGTPRMVHLGKQSGWK